MFLRYMHDLPITCMIMLFVCFYLCLYICIMKSCYAYILIVFRTMNLSKTVIVSVFLCYKLSFLEIMNLLTIFSQYYFKVTLGNNIYIKSTSKTLKDIKLWTHSIKNLLFTATVIDFLSNYVKQINQMIRTDFIN